MKTIFIGVVALIIANMFVKVANRWIDVYEGRQMAHTAAKLVEVGKDTGGRCTGDSQ